MIFALRNGLSMAILKIKIPKFFSPRFARRKGHVKHFIWKAAAEKWQIFFMKPSQYNADEIEILNFYKICPIFSNFAFNLSYFSNKKCLYFIFPDSKNEWEPWKNHWTGILFENVPQWIDFVH